MKGCIGCAKENKKSIGCQACTAKFTPSLLAIEQERATATRATEDRQAIYIIVTEDSGTDVEVKPFRDKEEAIAEARRMAKEYCRFPEDYTESVIDGWLFYVKYSCEGDKVTVREEELL